jgi:uncharacterized protein
MSDAEGPGTTTRIFVDADACPVKNEVVRVAARHGLAVLFVSNSWMRLPDDPRIERIVVPEGPDAADDWIATRIGPRDICITADILLAARCLKAGARAIAPDGKPFRPDSIGMTVAMRDLMAHLRDSGEVRTFNAAFKPADRSRFLQALEQAVQDMKRAG